MLIHLLHIYGADYACSLLPYRKYHCWL